MKEVLSQQEIDSLLNALDSGDIDSISIKDDEDKNKVRAYDFRRPIKLSKEYISTLYMIFDNFSKIMGNLLSAQIHTNINVKIGAVEQISFDEFINSTPNPSLMAVFHSKPLGGNQIIEINTQLCEQIIELMCGGLDNSSHTRTTKKKRFTDIEIGILEDIITIILKAFESAWKEIIVIQSEIDILETNPQMIQNMSPNEPVILTSFAVEIFNNTSLINICIPYVSLEDITDKLSIKSWYDFERNTNETDREALSNGIMASSVNLEVALGKATITVDDFLQLDTGDIFQLDMKTTDPLKMYVEDKLHYLVKPGVFNGKLAVEVLQYIEGDVEQ